MDLDQNSPEVMTALQAAVEASALCEKIRMDLAAAGALLKSDKSPVTIADFGSQAMICKRIRQKFPHDAIVAEEDSKELRRPDRSKTLDRVTDYINAFIPNSSPEEVCSWMGRRDFSEEINMRSPWRSSKRVG
jgi:3'(2'), 5'-bisphosphate nucleotidase